MTLAQNKLLRVGELAKACGKTVRAMHLYEELGLLIPDSRSTGGYRLYGPDAVTRVNWITKLQEIGFSLPEIQGFLQEFEAARSGPEGMGRVRAIFQERLQATRAQMARLATLEQDLSVSLAYLESCTGCEPVNTPACCGSCGHHGHDPAVAPDLVAGLAPRASSEESYRAGRAVENIDVPLSHLTEGNR